MLLEPKKILILSDWFLPAYKAGGPIRSLIGLTKLLSKTYSLFILTSNKDLADRQQLKGIETNKWTQKQVPVYYSEFGLGEAFRFYKVIKEISPDYIYINSIFSIRFALIPLAISKFYKKPNVVLAPRGMLHKNALNSKSLKKIVYLKLLIFLGLFRNVTVHNTNEVEFAASKRALGKIRDSIIAPNVPTIVNRGENFIKKIEGSLKLLFIGRINRIKGLDDLLKKLNVFKEPITLTIIGPIEDSKYYQECVKLSEVLPKNISVTFEGAKPFPQLSKYYSESHFFISPSLSENYGHSIFEALSAGMPVIINDNTPWKNLEDASVGWDLNFSDEVAFTSLIRKIIHMENNEFEKLSKNAKCFAQDNFNNKNLLSSYKKLFK